MTVDLCKFCRLGYLWIKSIPINFTHPLFFSIFPFVFYFSPSVLGSVRHLHDCFTFLGFSSCFNPTQFIPKAAAAYCAFARKDLTAKLGCCGGRAAAAGLAAGVCGEIRAGGSGGDGERRRSPSGGSSSILPDSPRKGLYESYFSILCNNSLRRNDYSNILRDGGRTNLRCERE